MTQVASRYGDHDLRGETHAKPTQVSFRTASEMLATDVTSSARVRTAPVADALDEAMDRYARGDDSAFAEVYDRLAPRLFGFLLRYTRDHAKVEDVVQQTMLQMHKNRGRFMPGAE